MTGDVPDELVELELELEESELDEPVPEELGLDDVLGVVDGVGDEVAADVDGALGEVPVVCAPVGNPVDACAVPFQNTAPATTATAALPMPSSAVTVRARRVPRILAFIVAPSDTVLLHFNSPRRIFQLS